MITLVPDLIRTNQLSAILDSFREKYGQLSRVGRLNGLLIVDQDAKVLAVNQFFDTNLNYWDIGAIGAALYGVSKQGRDFLSAGDLDRATMIYASKQFFVQNIGDIQLADGRTRELILIALGDTKMNLGLVVMQMRRLAPKILDQVQSDTQMHEVMQMSEKELCRHLETIRKEMIQFDTSSLPNVVPLRSFQIKIVYWGPGEAGKTTNYHRLKELFENCLISRGFSIATSSDRTLWNDSVWYQFPFAKLRLKVIVNVTTTTGQERFLTTREYILQNADGVVFVGDSLPEKRLENRQSFQELQTFTHSNPVPILVLLNKRDVPKAIPVDEFRTLLDLPEDTSTEKIIYQSIANDLANLGDVKEVFIEMIQQIIKRKLLIANSQR